MPAKFPAHKQTKFKFIYLHTNKRKFVSNLLNYQDWLTNREALTVLCSVGKHTGSRKTLGTNTGMRIMQELIFNWVCCGRTLCEPIVFIFGTEKEHNFKKNENIVTSPYVCLVLGFSGTSMGSCFV